MEEVLLADVLAAREKRALRQKILLQEYGFPLISFTMNIAGPVKTDDFSRAAFDLGRQRLLAALSSMGCCVIASEDNSSAAGFEMLLSVDALPEKLKKICTLLEDAEPIGRLFDMDVIGCDGEKLSRTKERSCLVCGAVGRECASRRLHSVTEIQQVTKKIIQDHFLESDGDEIASLAVRSLLDEVCIAPKPGLVDRFGSGSHRDMDIFSFNASASALWPYFKECFKTGNSFSSLPPADILPALRAPGLEAERIMYRVTEGVNTHKGAIYTLGILCAAAGRLWAVGKRPDAESWLRMCGNIASSNAAPGVREEVAAGLPAVQNIGLPALRRAEAAGFHFNDACLYTLLCLISAVRDTNMLSRGGESKADSARLMVEKYLAGISISTADPCLPEAGLIELNQYFKSENLSPGGCADLLSAALLVSRWSSDKSSK